MKMIKLALAVIIALASTTLYAETSPQTVTVALGETEVTLQCSPGGVELIHERYKSCRAIFNKESEKSLADQYCKPLAIAQACSYKPVTLTH